MPGITLNLCFRNIRQSGKCGIKNEEDINSPIEQRALVGCYLWLIC